MSKIALQFWSHLKTDSPTRDVLAILICGFAIFFVGLGNTHLWDQDEGFYATAAAEMHARNDWILPTFNKELFAHKPPMMFWGMRMGYSLFGVNETGARAVSALLGLVCALLVYRFATKLFDRTVAWYASIALITSLMFTMVARSATADVHLTLFAVLAFYLWWRFYTRGTGSSLERLQQIRWWEWGLVYSAMSLGVLTKGPIGFLFPSAVIGLFLIAEDIAETYGANRTWQDWLRWTACLWSPIRFLRTSWRMKPWIGFGCTMLIAGPWFAAVQWQSNGAFLDEFIGVHHLGRFSQAMDNHSGPIYFYFLACLIGMYPWTAFAIPTAIEWMRGSLCISNPKDREVEKRSIRLVGCWVAVYIGIFSLASTKLPNYVLPAYPALAIIVGYYFRAWTTRLTAHIRWQSIGWSIMGFIGLTIAVALYGIANLVIQGQTILDRFQISPALQVEIGRLWIVGVPLFLGSLFGMVSIAKKQATIASRQFIVVAVALAWIVWQIGAPRIDGFQSPQLLAEKLSKEYSTVSKLQLQTHQLFRPTMVFYWKDRIDFATQTSQVLDSVDSICILTEENWNIHRDDFPDSFRVLQRVANFPEPGELIVVGDQSLIR